MGTLMTQALAGQIFAGSASALTSAWPTLAQVEEARALQGMSAAEEIMAVSCLAQVVGGIGYRLSPDGGVHQESGSISLKRPRAQRGERFQGLMRKAQSRRIRPEERRALLDLLNIREKVKKLTEEEQGVRKELRARELVEESRGGGAPSRSASLPLLREAVGFLEGELEGLNHQWAKAQRARDRNGILRTEHKLDEVGSDYRLVWKRLFQAIVRQLAELRVEKHWPRFDAKAIERAHILWMRLEQSSLPPMHTQRGYYQHEALHQVRSEVGREKKRWGARVSSIERGASVIPSRLRAILRSAADARSCEILEEFEDAQRLGFSSPPSPTLGRQERRERLRGVRDPSTGQFS